MMRVLVPVATAALVTACAPAMSPEEEILPGEPAGSVSGVVVSVENDRPHTVRVFATRANMRFLVGEVPPRSERTFPLPPIILQGDGPLRLEADPRGSSQFQESDPVDLTDGRVIAWLLRAGGGDRVLVQ